MAMIQINFKDKNTHKSQFLLMGMIFQSISIKHLKAIQE